MIRTDAAHHRVDIDPTVPVTFADGRVEVVGISQLLREAHLISDLSGLTPPGYAAWRRILSVFAYRVTGLDATSGADTWRASRDDVWRRARFEPALIEAYYTRWAHRLDLFDPERPWLQVPELATQAEEKNIAEILTERPSGANTETLFSPYHEAIARPATIERVVEAMLVLYGYAAGGRMGTRTLVGATGRAVGFSGPLRAKVSYFPRGRTLFHSIVAGLVAPTSLPCYAAGHPDLAEWEADPSDPTGSRPEATGIISLLSHQAQRAVLLHPATGEQGETGVGRVRSTWRYAKNDGPDQEGDDPFTAYREEATEGVTRMVAKYSTMDWNIVDAWRALPAIVPAASGMTDITHRPPASIQGLATLPVSDASETMSVAVCVWKQNPGQAQNGDWSRSDTPDIHVALWSHDDGATSSTETWRSGITTWVTACEAEQRELFGALRNARARALNLAKSDKSATAWARSVEAAYWGEAYRRFSAAQDDPDLTGDEYERASQTARVALRPIVRRLYDLATTGQITARTAKQIVLCKPSILSANETLPLQEAG